MAYAISHVMCHVTWGVSGSTMKQTEILYVVASLMTYTLCGCLLGCWCFLNGRIMQWLDRTHGVMEISMASQRLATWCDIFVIATWRKLVSSWCYLHVAIYMAHLARMPLYRHLPFIVICITIVTGASTAPMNRLKP
jgi:hypothetical protein